jgi:translation initiation factor IF-1
MYFEGRVNLDKADKITGQITQAYQTTRRTSGKYSSDAPVFAFKLDNYNQLLGTYRPSRNYKKLLNKLKPGDVVTVTYKPMPLDKININVYQIEKGGQVVLGYDSYKNNHRIASIFIGVIAVLIIAFTTLKILRE